jgi:hypothetical protein
MSHRRANIGGRAFRRSRNDAIVTTGRDGRAAQNPATPARERREKVDLIEAQDYYPAVWDVILLDELNAELDELPGEVRRKLLAHAVTLRQLGPQL